MIGHFIKSQQGFSIIQGMMLAAAVAGMAYVGTRLTTDQKLAQKSAESKDKVASLHNMIYSILQNKDHCIATLAGIPLAPSSTQSLPKIITSTGSVPFSINSSGTYDPTLMYMNNSVSINRMNVNFPADLKDPATLAITYGRMENTDVTKRSGQGVGGKTVTRNISLKIQRTPGGALDGCYAVEQGQNQDLIENFCKELGATPGDISNSDSLFVWDPVNNVCRPRDLSCSNGRIFAGFDSNGVKRCNTIENWTDMTAMVDNSVPPNCSTATSVGFEIVGNKAKIKCVGGSGGCSSSCDCPGSEDVCESGVCVTHSGGAGCINGTYSKGDSSCRYVCSGGLWNCPMSPPGPPACNATCPTTPAAAITQCSAGFSGSGPYNTLAECDAATGDVGGCIYYGASCTQYWSCYTL